MGFPYSCSCEDNFKLKGKLCVSEIQTIILPPGFYIPYIRLIFRKWIKTYLYIFNILLNGYNCCSYGKFLFIKKVYLLKTILGGLSL